MALNFPDSPSLNQIYNDAASGFSYQWNGSVWISYTPSSVGQIKVIDDISGSFDGGTFTFPLTSGGTAISPTNSQSLIVNLGGVIQDSSDDYTVSGSNITFTTAPASGLSFSAVSLGVAFSVNTTGVGIQSAGSQIGVGITQINFTGPSNSVTLSGLTADINIASGVGIQSAGSQIGVGITQLNFVGTGNTFAVNGDTIDISISGGGGGGLSLDSYYFTGI